MDFKEKEIKDLSENPFKLIGDDWMLITAGKSDDFNTMTASWGNMGILWHKPVATCFIRPQRHTFDYANNAPYFTLSFFDEKYRKILNFCGSRSGRDTDKVKETGLNPVFIEDNIIGFEQARMVIVCKKLYEGDLQPGNFLFQELIDKNYKKNDFHRFYIGEIVKYLEK